MAKKTTTVILKENVASLGKTGEQHVVSVGYARNFLLPRGLALVANDQIIQEQARKQERKKARATEIIERAKADVKKLEGKIVTLRMKAGQRGKLFGAVTSKDIASALKDQHSISVQASAIELAGPIKTLGKHKIPLALTPQTSASVTLQIVSEKS